MREHHYDSVGEALLWTLGRDLGAAFTPELRDAWAAAYGLLSRAMIETARHAPLPGAHLVPGMPVEAQVQLGRRGFFRYLARPLLDGFQSAFREG